MPLLGFRAELGRVRVQSGAQDIRIYININANISKFRYIYQKNHNTNKNSLFNCDEDSNIFLQLYIVVHYYIFSTIHPLNIFSIYIYILYLSKLLHFSILSTNKIYLFFLYFFYVHTLIHTLLLTYSTTSTSTMARTSTSSDGASINLQEGPICLMKLKVYTNTGSISN